MKFFKVSLLCCVLSGLSATVTNAAEDNPVDAYLQDRGTAPAARNYGILTSKGKFSSQWKAAVGAKNCNRLTSAAALTDSHVRLVSEGKEGKDTLKAAKSIDRLSVATNLIREGKATQKATVATNKQYLKFTYMKGINLAARLGAVTNLASVFELVSHDLGVNAQECKTAEDKLHLQLALLTVGFYAESIKVDDIGNALNALTPEKDIVGNLGTMLGKQTYQSFIKELAKGGYNEKAAALYGDANQNFFEFAEDGTMLSAPRPLFLRTTKKTKKRQPILRAVEIAKEKDKTKNGSIVPAASAYLQKYFLIDTAEQAQSLIVLFAMASPKEVSYADFVQWTQTGDLMNKDKTSFSNPATAVQHVLENIKLTLKAAPAASPSRDRLVNKDDEGPAKPTAKSTAKPVPAASPARKGSGTDKEKTPAKPAEKKADKAKGSSAEKPKAETPAKPAPAEEDDEEDDEEIYEEVDEEADEEEDEE